MNPKIMKVYEEMYIILIEEFKDHEKAWDYLIEFFIFSNYPKFIFAVNHKFEWLLQNRPLAESLMKAYDVELLSSDKYDYLGELLWKYRKELKLDYERECILPDDTLMEKEARKVIKKAGKQIKIITLGTSTGRYILKLSEIAPNAVFFGIDRDIKLLRIAYANCAIHNINVYLLCADYLIHEYDYRNPNGAHNWEFANKWYPCWDKLKPKVESSEPTIMK